MISENKNRILAIDLARGVSVLMVIIVHTLWMYGDVHTQENTWVGEVIHFIGKGTPMFLIAMGFSFLLSRNQSILLSCKRALQLLLLGYIMNFLKFVLPTIIGITPDNFIEAYGWSAPASANNLGYMLLTGDILQLAGVSLFFMGVLNHFIKNKYALLLLALVIAVATPFVRGIHMDILFVDYFLDLLWDAEYHVYFAFFPWASFIFIGMFFGKWYREKGASEITIFNRILLFGVVLISIGGALCFTNFGFHFGDYFHLGPGGTIYLAGFNLILIWLAYALVKSIKHNKIFQFFYWASKRVTTIYIIQWVFICWTMGALGYQSFGVTGVLVMLPITITCTLILQKSMDKLFHKEKPVSRKEKQQNIKALIKGA